MFLIISNSQIESWISELEKFRIKPDHKAVFFLGKNRPTQTDEDFNPTYIHPEHSKEFRLKEVLGMYVWHVKHHFAHTDYYFCRAGDVSLAG